MKFFTKNKIIAGVIGLIAVVGVVNTHAIIKISNNFEGSQLGQVRSATQVKTTQTTQATKTYVRGEKAEVVRQVQEALTKQGFYKGEISGTFGPLTERAVRDFQTKNGLRATGQLDPNTVDVALRGGGRTPPGFELANGGGSGDCPVIGYNSNGTPMYPPGCESGGGGCTEGTIIGYDSMGNPIYCAEGGLGCTEGTIIGYNPDKTPIFCNGVYNDCAEGTIIGYTSSGTPIYCGDSSGSGGVACPIIGYSSSGAPLYPAGCDTVNACPVIGYNSAGVPVYPIGC